MIEKVKKYFHAIVKRNILLTKCDYIFIISHMRSRSTLLSHILGTHQNICGHNELFISYDTRTAFLKMKAALARERNFTQARYLLDKLLHCNLKITSKLSRGNNKFIIMLRAPEASLASMATMHQKLNDNNGYQHLAKYYQKQLLHIQESAKLITNDYFYLDSEDLVENTSSTLEQLTRYLDLPTPLSENYNIFTDTGEAGKGDPSDNIKHGAITKTAPSEQSHFSKEEITELTKLYSETRTLLKTHSIKT